MTQTRKVREIPQDLLNLYALHKQFLLPAPWKPDAITVVERLVGVPAAQPETPYLALQSRLSSLTAGDLGYLMYRQSALLRAHAMRRAPYLLALSQYETILTATSGELDDSYGRAPTELADREAVEAEIVCLVETNGPMTGDELGEALSVKLGRETRQQLINYLCTKDVLINAGVRGSWRSNVYVWALRQRWQPNIPPGERDPKVARMWLVARYLETYGPATLADIAWWTGFSQGRARRALDHLAAVRPVTEIRLPALGADGYLFVDDLAQLEAWQPPETPVVNFLPASDPYLVAYEDRSRLLNGADHDRVFYDSAGCTAPAILYNGKVIGVWKYEVKDRRLVYELFEKERATPAQALQEAEQHMVAFLIAADSPQGGRYLR